MARMAIPDGYNMPELELRSKPKARSVEIFMKRFRPGVLRLQRACYSLVMLAVAGILVFAYFQPAPEISPSSQTLLALPTSLMPSNYWQRVTLQHVITRSPMHIEDVVSVDSGEVLVFVRSFESWPTDREKIGCRVGDESSKPLAIHRMQANQVGILCGAPTGNLSWDMDSISIEVDQKQAIGSGGINYQHPLLWKANNLLVYTSLAMEQEVLVFVHGINNREKHVSMEKFRCVFDGRLETRIISQAQEVFRCAHPPKHLIPSLARKKVSLRVEDQCLLPSLAVYNPTILQQKVSHDNICACTMVYNSAKFIREWVHYHAHLGVEKFFLYDNNSEDNLDEVIASLNPTFNVVKQPWPWVKTQEAGFSHCAVMAKRSCKWMLFIDVDEYFFPHPRFLSPTSNVSRLASFITAASAGRHSGRLGQIMTFCYDFGPSGLTSSPSSGITQGYTCRVKHIERHKSIVLLSAIAHSLINVIHHFELKSGYQTKKIFPSTAVINHYKFQVWDEFKVKFKRRASTYVADWTNRRNLASKDRVPDLGTTALKPADWESRYCEVQDYRLRNYTRSVFGSYDKESKLHFAWE